MTSSPKPPRAVAGVYRAAPEPHRSTMLEMRRRILRIVPNAQEVVSYGIAAFKVNDTIVCGLLAAKHHVGYYPFSGDVLKRFPHELRTYSSTKSAVHVPVDNPLPSTLLRKLIAARAPQGRATARVASSAKARAVNAAKSQHLDAEWRAIGLAAPARRALANAKIHRVRDLRTWREADVRALHGIGNNAMVALRREMRRAGITFRAR
ncbi:MAG: iron chaperone [Ilumatobacteraceae bacterium]